LGEVVDVYLDEEFGRCFEDKDERVGRCVVLAERVFLGRVVLVLAVDGRSYFDLLFPDFEVWRNSCFDPDVKSCFDRDVRSYFDGEVRSYLDFPECFDSYA
jgi:hypothetical protein